MAERPEFTRFEAESIWARLVAGWANHLDPTGARLLIDGNMNQQDAGGSYEGVTRMLWGLGGWLSRPERSPIVVWRGVEYDTLALTRAALLAGTDPASIGYWGVPREPGSSDQRTVEAGQVAFALWQTRERIWDHLNADQRERIVAWLDACSRHPGTWRNNWALFWALNHACRKALGARHEAEIIIEVLAYLDDVYCGDGWYDDGPARGTNHFDDYNLWVFASHVLAWSQVDGGNHPELQTELLDRVRRLMDHLPSFFAANGAYPEYGRSLAYKFARLGAPIWAYHQGAWTHASGVLRRLAGRHLRWYVDRGAVRADDTLRQELTSDGSPDIRETYISTGAAYWAMQAFGALWTLADNDPFWTDPEQPIPVEEDDFVRVLPEPGWVLIGTKSTGEIQRFSARSQHTAAKYGKFHYTTAAPFNPGLIDGVPSPDGMLALVAGSETGHRDATTVAAVGEPGWLRLRYGQQVGGRKHQIETAILVRGQCHLRVHRVHLAPGTPWLSAVEGAAPLGFPSGQIVELGRLESDDLACCSWATAGPRSVAIVGLEGYARAERPSAWMGRHDLNGVFGNSVLPRLEASRVVSGQVLVSMVWIGDRIEAATLINTRPRVEWDASDRIIVHWPDAEPVSIPPLGAS